jgi:single-strand DNA-binding protein
MPEHSFNRVELIGRLARDPEVRTVQSGDKVASFAVATSDHWKNDAGSTQERTQFHPVTVWNQALIEATVPHLRKGSRVHIEGSLEHRQYEKDGQKRTATEVVIRPYRGSIGFLDRAPQSDPAAAGPR